MDSIVKGTLKHVEVEIVHRIAKQHRDGGRFLVVLEGGYFTTAIGADEFTLQSQRSVFRLARHLKRRYGNDIRIVFGILANDLGKICASDADVCDIGPPRTAPAQIAIPPLLQQELDAFPYFRGDHLAFLTERQARNRGIRYFRTYFRQHEDDIRHGHSHLTVSNEDAHLTLSFAAQNGQLTAVAKLHDDWQWSSYCPLIMAQHYADVCMRARNLYVNTGDCIIVDLAFIDDRQKVSKGAELALLSYPHMRNCSIMNVCFGDDEGELYAIDEHHSAGVSL